MKAVILHYHLFKNAGSSIDKILKDSFGSAWQNWDLGPKETILPDDMAEFINSNPQLRAVSSHNVVPPVPQGSFMVFPIILIRHPIARARSAYLFEWKKQLGMNEPKGSFSEYVDEKLSAAGDNVIANFHVAKLSNTAYSNKFTGAPLRNHERLERAKLFLSSIPYFGLVEHFQQSLVRLHYYLKPNFPEIKVKNYQANVMQDISVQVSDRVREIEEELGQERYNRLQERNDLDLKFYEYACKQFFSVARSGQCTVS